LSVALNVFVLVASVRAQAAPAKPKLPPAPPPDAHVTVREVGIVIADSACQVAEVWAVINDIDRIEWPAEKIKAEWVVHIDDEHAFDATVAHASLRLRTISTDCRSTEVDWKHQSLQANRQPAGVDPNQRMRTDCQPAKVDLNQRVARFTFAKINTQLAQKVTIHPTTIHPTVLPAEDFYISYVRRLPSRSPETVPCNERAHLLADQYNPINAVRLPNEQLVLQFGTRPDAPGLRINDVLNLIQDVGGDEARILAPDDIVYVFTVRHGKGDASSPHVSSSAIDIEIRKLKDARLDKLEVKVE
jgi:hypothetical protein